MSDAEPGLTLTSEGVIAPDATLVLDNRPPKDLWSELVDDTFMDAMARAIQQNIGHAAPGQRASLLYEAGVTAMDGAYASVVAGLLRPDGGVTDFMGDAKKTTRAFLAGQHTLSLLRAPYAELLNGPLAVFTATGNVPVIEVRLDPEAFYKRKSTQRERACNFLVQLGAVADVRLVGSRLDHHAFTKQNHDYLPTSVCEQCSPATTSTVGSTEDVVARAWETFDPDGPQVRTLRLVNHLAEGYVTYDALEKVFWATRRTMRGYTKELRDSGLLETFDSGGHTYAGLTEAGRAFLADLDAEQALQKTFAEYVCASPNSRLDSRVSSATPVEGAHRVLSDTEVVEMASWRSDALLGTAVDDGVTVCDAIQHEKADRNEPEVAVDPVEREVAIGAEWDNPHAYTVRTALALSHSSVLSGVLPDSVLKRLLDRYGLTILQHGTCVGWLKNVTDGASFREALERGREAVYDACDDVRTFRKKRDAGEVSNAEFKAIRAVSTRTAHGLATVMAHLLDLADVRIVREVRLPGRTTKRLAEKQRASLAENLWNLAAKQSLYGAFSPFRQLFEQDEEKRSSAISPEVDAADPFGGLTGAFVVTGHRVSEFSDLLERVFSNVKPHEDAPEFAISVPFHDGYSRPQALVTAKRVCERKNRRVTREAVAILHGFTGSPYGVAKALSHLSPVPTERDLTLEEVRGCLGNLDREHEDGFEGGYELLPHTDSPTERDVIRVLLTTDSRLSVSEIATRAGRSSDSVRSALSRLEALDLVFETAFGWRIRLTVESLDGTTEDVSPWYVTAAEAAPTLETVIHGVWTRLPPDAGGGNAAPPAWFGRWVAVLRRFVGGDGRSRAVLLGDPPEQQPLPGVEVPG